MPELPEAETIARELDAPLRGRRVRSVAVIHPDLVEPDPETFVDTLTGATFQEVGRRGKNVVLALTLPSGAGRRWVVNLGMSGRLLFRAAADPSPDPSHPGVEAVLDGGDRVIYHDPRRFGRLRILDEDGFAAWSDTLGPEPLEDGFTSIRLSVELAASRSPIRSWLLDQRRVAGVGNIYANEALFLAGIHPALPANRVGNAGARRLHETLREVLRSAVQARGTTLRDYRTATGSEGEFAPALQVYGRAGSPCPRCRTPVERLVLSNRSAFFCPRCQPEGGEE